jgi:ArsR family transcriptional regulator
MYFVKMKDNTRLFKALSDTNRLRILKMLQTKPLCVCEITDILSLATSTVSKHLSILRQTGFIIEEKDGKWVNYLINPRPADNRISSILSTLDFWISDEKTIIADKEKIQKVDRILLCSK